MVWGKILHVKDFILTGTLGSRVGWILLLDNKSKRFSFSAKKIKASLKRNFNNSLHVNISGKKIKEKVELPSFQTPTESLKADDGKAGITVNSCMTSSGNISLHDLIGHVFR